MNRPVNCLFCRKKLYYFEESKINIPEVSIRVTDGCNKDKELFYAHEKCWIEFKESKGE